MADKGSVIPPTHIAGYAVFSDESRYSAGRFRSIAAVSLPANRVVAARDRVSSILDATDVRESKWHELKSARTRFCAVALLTYLVDEMLQAGARADVLIWDTHDSRHEIERRDDRQNFERMFFHLHSALMRRREPGAPWHIRPDQRMDIDWKTIRSCLHGVGQWKQYFEQPLLGGVFSISAFKVKTFQEVMSDTTPICQIADLLAGMAAYTRTHSELVSAWLRHESGQLSLLDQPPLPPLTGRDKERLPVISQFYRLCRGRHLGVSLHSNGYFLTRDPKQPVNFWHYVPQHPADKAPTHAG